MDPENLFRVNLAVIDRVIAEVCRGARVPPDEAEDFAASVKLSLIENEYAVLRRWEGRCSLAGFLSVVIRRLLADRRDHELGRWRPSVEAERLGPAGVMLEKLLHRDGRSLDEALPALRAHDPSLTREAVARMAAQFRPRARRPRAVALADADEDALPGGDRADGLVMASEVRRISRRASGVVRETMAAWSDEDAMIIRFRFGSSMSTAEIARMLRLPQRPLYRRIEALLARLRTALVGAGLDAAVLAEIIGEASQEMDFGLGDGKTPAVGRSVEQQDPAATEEWR